MPAATADSGARPPDGLLDAIRLSSSAGGPIKKLTGFKKNVHTVPDADTPATNARPACGSCAGMFTSNYMKLVV